MAGPPVSAMHPRQLAKNARGKLVDAGILSPLVDTSNPVFYPADGIVDVAGAEDGA
jgi:hypothetical protein